jgi:exosome complex RNA-binding protein Csl4
VEVLGHKAHGAVPQPGGIVIARVRSLSNRQSIAANR